MTGRPRLVHTVRVRAPAEDVWRAITDPAFTEQYFFGLRVRSNWSVGARIVYEHPEGATYIDGEIIGCEAPRMLRHSVRILRDADTAGDLPSRITWEVVPVDGGCDVTVVHDEFEAETESYRAVRGGWPTALEGLTRLLETGTAAAVQERWPDHLPRPEATIRSKPHGR